MPVVTDFSSLSGFIRQINMMVFLELRMIAGRLSFCEQLFRASQCCLQRYTVFLQCCAPSPLHTFPRNFPVDGEAALRGSCQLVIRTCLLCCGLVADLLWTCYGETGVIGFDHYNATPRPTFLQSYVPSDSSSFVTKQLSLLCRYIAISHVHARTVVYLVGSITDRNQPW